MDVPAVVTRCTGAAILAVCLVVAMCRGEPQVIAPSLVPATDGLPRRSPDDRPLGGHRGTVRPGDLARLHSARRSVIVRSRGRLHRFVLATGETITGELIELSDLALEFRVRGEGTTRVPRSAVAEIRPLADEIDVALRPDRNGSAPDSGGPGLRLCEGPEPVRAGRVSFAAGGRSTSGVESRVELEFAAGEESHALRLVAEPRQAFYRVELPDSLAASMQPIAAHSGQRAWTVLFDPRRLLVLVDDAVLLSGRAPPGPLTGVRIVTRTVDVAADPGESEGEPTSGIESLRVQRYDPHDAAGPAAAIRGSESVLLCGGNRLFGAVSADHGGVRISGTYDVTVPWSDVCRIAIGGTPPAGAPVRGVIAQIELQPLADHFPHDGDRLLAAIAPADDGHVEIAHPLAGVLRLPAAHVRQIEPHYTGSRVLLSAGVHHLGDEIRAEFASPEPYGTALDGKFTIENLPGGAAFFAVEAAELEPCGPGTPRGSPFLAALRDGQLTTTVIVNGVSIGTLNEAIRIRAAAGRPRRIRLPFDAGILQPGRNTWRIEQRSSAADPRVFDDCEVGRIAVEIEEPDSAGSE